MFAFSLLPSPSKASFKIKLSFQECVFSKPIEHPTPLVSMGCVPYHRLILLVYLFFAVVLAQNCTRNGAVRAGTIFKNCYDATYGLIRRGLADDIASYHLREALSDIKRYAKTTVMLSPSLYDTCIPQDVYGRTFSVRWTTIFTETSLDDMLLSISDVFNNANTSASSPPTPRASQLKDKAEHWERIKGELLKAPHEVDMWNFYFPQTVKHFYDERHEAVCAEWRKHSSSETTFADKGLENILKMAVKLISVGCDVNKSWQLLRHYTALVHLGIRCDHKEGADLKVPNTFMGAYNAAAMQIMEDARRLGTLKPFDNLDDYAFDIVYRFIIKRLASFGSWGVADMVFHSNIVLKNTMGFASHTVNEKLKTMNHVVRTYGNKIPFVVRNEQGTNTGMPDCNTEKNIQGSLKCDNGGAYKYCYYNPNNEPFTADNYKEKCCAKLLCTNAVTHLSGTISYKECCKEHNQATRDSSMKREIPFNNALTMPLSEHVGDSAVKTVHVYLR